jgi:hypothetical protein
MIRDNLKFRTEPKSVLVAVMLFNLTLAPSGFAQQSSNPLNKLFTARNGSTVRKKNTSNPEFKIERLNKPIETPDMPVYAGRKVQYVTGTLFPQVKGGPSATMEFSTADEPKKVLDWYKQTLEQNQWEPLDHMTGANGLAAMKDHNICQVMTLAPTKTGSKCDFLLRYKFYRADSVPN